jgi:hypothetical protein
MDLGRRQAGPAGILHGFQHVFDQPRNLRRTRIGHRLGPAAQDGMAHAGDLQNCHGRNMAPTGVPVKAGRARP